MKDAPLVDSFEFSTAEMTDFYLFVGIGRDASATGLTALSAPDPADLVFGGTEISEYLDHGSFAVASDGS